MFNRAPTFQSRLAIVCVLFLGFGSLLCVAILYIRSNQAYFDVRDLGAKCNTYWDGRDWVLGADDTSAIQRAIDLGLNVHFPAGRACFAKKTLVVRNRFNEISGAGMGLSTIIGGESANPIIRFGDTGSAINHTHIHDLSFSRIDCGKSGTVGLMWSNFNYAIETRVDVQCNAINRIITGPDANRLSVSYTGNMIYSSNASKAYLLVENAAGINLLNPEFGLNGGEKFFVPCQVIIRGPANAFQIAGGNLIAQGPSEGSKALGANGSVLCFRGATNPATVVKLIDVNTENYTTVISSDSATHTIGEMAIHGGRFGGGSRTNFFALNEDTRLVSFQGDGFSVGSAFAIGSVSKSYGKWSNLTGVIFGGPVKISGGPSAVPTDVSIYGCTFLSDVTLEGAFTKLIFGGVVMGKFSDRSIAKARTMSVN